MKSALVTGCNGFIGHYLCQELVKTHHVMGLGRQEVSTANVSEYRQVDITDREALSKIFRQSDFDEIYHLAGPTIRKSLMADAYQALKVMVLGTANILDEFEKSNAIKFFFSSTGKVYSPTPDGSPIKETHAAIPTNFLGKGKLAAESVVNSYSQTKRKEYIVGRIFNVFGPGQANAFLIPHLLSELARGPNVRLGYLDRKRDYLFVDDVVAAIQESMGLATAGTTVVNIGSGEPRTARDILDALEGILQMKIHPKIEGTMTRGDEGEIEVADTSRLRTAGWKPRVCLSEGLRKCLEPNQRRSP